MDIPRALNNKHSSVFLFLKALRVFDLGVLLSFPRCSVCVPVAQSCPQWPCSVDAGHPPPAPGERLQAPGPAAPPPGWLDQGRWRAPGLADETTCSCARRRGSWSQVNHCCHLPISHVICWPHRGEQFPELGSGTHRCRVKFQKSKSTSGILYEQILTSFGLFSLSDLIVSI